MTKQQSNQKCSCGSCLKFKRCCGKKGKYIDRLEVTPAEIEDEYRKRFKEIQETKLTE